MSNVIEKAKSGRAKCRKCRESIAKDAFRFGLEVAGEFGDAVQWYHLNCAAQKVPADLEAALKDCTDDVPNRAELQAEIEQHRGKQKPTTYPYAELAPSARSTCLICDQKIAKDEPRIAIEREIDAGGFTRQGAGYLHPQCAMLYEEVPDDLAAQLRVNSISLTADQLAGVLKQLE
jgi:Poly(ADP-ribose) polymerase and DNA-Ligase Zn-finger region